MRVELCSSLDSTLLRFINLKKDKYFIDKSMRVQFCSFLDSTLFKFIHGWLLTYFSNDNGLNLTSL